MKITTTEVELILELIEEMEEHISNMLDVIYYIVDKNDHVVNKKVEEE